MIRYLQIFGAQSACGHYLLLCGQMFTVTVELIRLVILLVKFAGNVAINAIDTLG